MKYFTQGTTKQSHGRLCRILMTAMMMLTSGMAWAWAPTSAGTYYLRSTGTDNNFNVYTQANGQGAATATDQIELTGFTISSGTYRLVFENTSTIIMNGQIFINAAAADNAHLIMELGSGATANPTMKITGVSPQYASGQQAAFHINNIQNTDRTKHTITIQGNDPSVGSTENIDKFVYDFANNFVIDGDGPVLQAVDGNTMSPKAKVTIAGNRKAYGMFRIQQGTLNLKNVTIQNFSTTWGNGGTIQVFVNQSNSAVKVDIDHCFFTSIATRNEPVLKLQTNGQNFTNDNVDYRNAYVKKSKFEKTFGIETPPTTLGAEAAVNRAYGTIRSYGNNKTTLEINQCHLNGNYGCPVRWHGCGTTTPMKVYNCLIENNFTKVETNVNGGGGLLLKGPADIQNCTIRSNRTNGNGGGIYLSTYTDFNGGTRDFIPEHTIMQLDPTTVIHDNIAEGNGGGVAIEAKRMFNNYYQSTYLNNTYGYIYWTANPDGSPNEPFRVEFQQNGGKVYDNTSNGGYGGGVYINRESQCTYYGVVCKLDYGEITGNTAAKGGGVAIVTTTNYSNPPAPSGTGIPEVAPQDVTVEVSGASLNQQMLIQCNTATTNGGGIYVQAYPLTYNNITSTVSTNLFDYSVIDNNTATTNGGGLYIQSGTVGILKNNDNGTNKPTISKNIATSGNGGGVYLDDGTVNMKGALVGGASTTMGNTAGTSGGGVYVNQGSVNMVSSVVKYNQATAGNGGGIFVNTGDVFINRTEQGGGITPSQITYNKAHNGGGIYNHAGSILAFGTVGTGEAGHVQISNNQATAGSGGGIYCTGDATTSSYDIRLRRVDIKSNTATENGGGIYLGQGKISVVNGIIDGNSADGSGGGVYTHQGNIDINPTGDERNATQITNNTAAINGGGLNTHEGFITVQGNNKDQRVIIKNNTATTGSGGAIFCMGESSNAEYITVRHADLVSNKAQLGTANYGTGSEVAAGCGGGIYLQQGKITITDVNIQNNYAKVNGGGINNHSGSIDVNGCYIGSSHSTSGDHYYKADAADGDTDRGNKADNSGGGIYTRLGDIDIEDYVETSGNIFREESKVTFNEAAKNGGGIDTHEGIIYINKEEEDDQIEVAFNKAERGGGLYANAGTIKAYNALIHDNTATLHGGGANNHSGDIIIYGGILSNNTAKEGHGGGAYTNVGDIDLFQFPSTELQNPTLNHGTKVYNNIAKLNGGAFNNHTGRVDVRHATIYNNTATLGNGGAIYCEGPHANVDRGLGFTIRLLCSDMVQNKTRGQDGTETAPTGRGGGIYLKYGSIYAHYSNIRDNEANIAGGGLNNHEGNILLYGCDITGNRALELDGGGIFIKSGSITTGPSTVREAAPTSAKATIVQNNTAYRNGGGIINLDGDITLNGDLIGGATSNLGNKALTGNGGGVYIANGIINMKGGQIDNNTAEHGKGGGVYSGGGEFNIGEREGNPTPIVLLVDSEVKRMEGGQTATVHYHLVDQGKYGNDVSNVAHGIIWGTSNQPTTEVVYNTTTGGYNYVQGEPACERIIIPSSMINAGTTYYAKAFYRYTTGGNVITGYSETIKFVTFSNSEPLVISGSVSNITKNSAQGSGRVMDNGGSIITERGVEIRRDKIGDETTAPAPIKIPASETTEFFTVSNLRDPSYPTDNVSLIPNTTYYAKAYATNSNGQTGYGNEVEFTTLKDTPDMGNGLVTVTTSIENGVIVATASFTMPSGTTFGNGTNDVKAYGFIWSRDDDPELSTDHTVPGTLTQGTTTFTTNYTGVTSGITFYVRAYASTIESGVTPNTDITNYSLSAATQHVAPMLDGCPVVRAIGISGITQNSATITCQIYSGYQARTTKYGVYVDNLTNTTENIPEHNTHYFPYTTEATQNVDPNDPNNVYPYTYTVQLTGLTSGTTYYLKAYGTNATSPSYATENPTVFNYGNGYNFTALPVMQPNVVITSVSNIQKTSATINCSVEDGGGNITAYGIKYSIDPNMANPTTVAGSNLSGSTFSVALDNTNHDLLTAHTTYYVQAYATNSAGTHTCQKVSFTTDYDHPSVAFTDNGTIIPISGVDFAITGQNSYQYTAVGNYTVTPNATSNEPVQTHGVCWSIFHDPTRRNSDVSDSHYAETTETVSSETNKSMTFHPAYPNTKYYVHAYVSTSTPDTNNELADIVYDPAGSNITFVSLPIVHTGGATAITNSSASLTVNINSPDREHHLRKYGVCWIERTDGTETPTKTAGHFVEGDITAANPTTASYNLTANVGADEGTSKTYRYRAYCINENSDDQGNIAYGDIKEFTTTAYTITATALPATAGTVSGGGGFNSGASCTLTATVSDNDNYAFAGWYDGTTQASTANPYTFTVNASKDYVAHFNSKVTLTAGEGGQVSFDGSTWNNGSINSMNAYNASITARAQVSTTGYDFVNWTDANGNEVSTSATYTFNVTDAISLTANFVSNRRSTSMNTSPRPRDIYPAPAREPWDWEDFMDGFAPLAMTDTLVPTRATTTAPVNKPSINNNSAEYGGGVYVEYNEQNPAKIVFAGGGDNEHVGTINNNTATEAGGGIYISQGASMQMKGHCQVNSNHVPAGKKGGGIYLDGTLLVGNQASDPTNAHALQVNQNWIGDGAYTDATRNNVYLPTDPILTGDALHKMRVITLLSDISGKTGTQYNSKIGLSVDRGFREVIYSEKDEHESPNVVSSKKWLEKLMPETGSLTLNSAIFEDSQQYYALHVTPSDDLFDEDYIYLWSCWTSIVAKDPNTSASPFYVADDTHYEKDANNVWHIKTNYGLAWFSSIINGLNNQTADPTAKAVIENDLDMSAYFWVPLGSVSGSTGSGTEIAFTDGGSYQGIFNGQGHVIKGLICTYMTGIKKYGLFGTASSNAIIKNTFVDDYRFSTYWQKSGTSMIETGYRMGGIAAETEGNAVISNCEARGTMKTPYCTANETYVGGLVGLMKGTNEVHSSMAMPEISGKAQKVGGLVGQINASNVLKNSFANMKLGNIDNTTQNPVNVGGLVGNNLGTVENCYVRLQNIYDDNAPTNFYWFAGSNTGTVTYCYAPARSDCSFDYVPSETTGVSKHGKYGLTSMSEYGTSSVRRRKYQFDQKDQQIALDPNQTNTHVVNGIFNGLLPTLNHWVESANTPSTPDPGAKEGTAEPKYSTWSRTMASPLNDDYPILEFADFDCLASTDNIYLEYKADLDDMIEKYNGIENGGNIYLYSSERTNATTDGRETVTNLVNNSTDDDVRVYINENVGILQDEDSNINARVGVTLDNSKGTTEIGGEHYDWHMFSSALTSASMGLKYHTNETGYPGVDNYYILNNFENLSANGIPHDYYVNRINMDPPKTTWFQGNVCIDSVGYFPINTPYGTWRDQPAGDNGSFDFYCYGEAYYQHWINFKREGREGLYDHWRQDPDPDNFRHYQIKYPNESTFTQAKGYMVGINEKHSDLENGGYERNPERRNMMMADGELNNGKIEYKATYTTNPEATAYDFEVRGCNLIGNPYQSYLNFDEFIDKNRGKVLGNTYFILDADAGRYVSYTTGASENPIAAPGYIHPHQGFLVKVRENQTLTFTNTMRSASGNSDSYFRSGRLNYPLVNLICTDATGKCDATTIEINRPDVGGGQKMKGIRTGNALVYVHLDGVDYQTAFAPVGITSAPVRFDVLEDGIFTMRWGTMHGDFSYLHLIDNLTGMDVDCLRQSEYHFEAKTTDYKSRFKLVFECTGVEEQEDDGSGGPSTFAFRMGDELVINGEGYLQVFDLNGRQLLAKQVYGTQNTVGLPKVAAGLYVLRLTTNNQSKTQKMVIE